MERNPKIVVVVLTLLMWLPRILGLAVDPIGCIAELVGSLIGAWFIVFCVLRILAWLKVRRGTEESEVNEG